MVLVNPMNLLNPMNQLPWRGSASTRATIGRRSGVGRRSLRALAGAAPSELRLRQLVEVIGAIADRLSFGIEEFKRLLKRDRRRCGARHGRIEDVQPVLVQIDGNVAPRHVRIDDRELLTGDEIDVVEVVERDLDARLEAVELRRGPLYRSEDIDLPVRGRRKVIRVM